MKTQFRLILSCLPALAAALPLSVSGAALQMSATLTTNFGKSYENYRVIQKDPDGVYIKHSNGIAKILFADLAEKDRTALGYDAGKEEAYAKERVAKRERVFHQAADLQKEWVKAQATAAEADLMQMRMEAQGYNGSGYAGGYAPMYDAGLPWLGTWGGGTGNAFGNGNGYGNGRGYGYGYGNSYGNGHGYGYGYGNGYGNDHGYGCGYGRNASRRQMTGWGPWNCGYNSGGLACRVGVNTLPSSVSCGSQIVNTRALNTFPAPRPANNVPFATPALSGSVPALAPRNPAPVAPIARLNVSVGARPVGGGGARK